MLNRNVHASDSNLSAAFCVWQSLACLLNCRHIYFSTGFFCVLFRFFFPRVRRLLGCGSRKSLRSAPCPKDNFHLIRYKFIYLTTESKTDWRRGWSIYGCHLCKPYSSFCVMSTCCSALRDL